jgi:leucyl-tRNA synthetase
VVLPEEISKTHGIDTARLFLVSIASPDKDLEWSDEGINGSLRLVNRMFEFMENFKPSGMSALNSSKFNRLIKEYTDDIGNLRYNLATIKLKEMFSSIESGCTKSDAAVFITLLSPICPHIAEEFWEMIGNKPFVSIQSWPEADKSKIDLKAEAAEGTAHSTIKDVHGILNMAKIEKPKKITFIVSELWRYDFVKKLKSELEKTHDIGELIKATMDKEHSAEVSKLVPKLVKDRSKIPETITSQKEELKALEQNKQAFKSEFNAEIDIIKAEDSDNPKANNAMPGKPAILVE